LLLLRGLLLSVLLCASTAAQAQDTLTLGVYKQYSKSGGDVMRNYLSGLRDGIVIYDTYAGKYLHAQKHICSDGQGLDADKFKAVLDAQIEEGGADGKAWPDDIPLQAVAIFALLKVYPCAS